MVEGKEREREGGGHRIEIFYSFFSLNALRSALVLSQSHAHTHAHAQTYALFSSSNIVNTADLCGLDRGKKIHEQAKKAKKRRKEGSKIINDGQWTSVFVFVVISTCASQCRGHVPVTGVSEL